jgi:2-C-methyl-D-erythritol 4-phosphate cytidylyltransferase/2-C-methyl-D-erythritol 2,4-cyclodiphosphate synthase
VASKDTVRRVCESDPAAESVTLDRRQLFNVQTPQGFETGLIKRAFQKAYEEEYYGTDDAVLAERIGCNVALAPGSYGNIKITTKEDLPVETRVGSGFDVHRLTHDRELILCGVKIPFEKGLLGHSDADVALHALMDAMLGAAAMGDIGRHFPDSEERYKGISSMKLLNETYRLITDAGYKVGNIDITIMAQRPKMLPYISQMRENIASALGMRQDNVNVKATTTERLGFVGREEGIAAEAVCILTKG